MNRAEPIHDSLPKSTGRARGRVRTKPGDMNKTEARYARYLDEQKIMGIIADWWFQSVTLKLGHDTRYTPDFVVLMPDGLIEFRDTKGWDTEPAAAVKERVCSTMFPLFVFKEARWEKNDWVHKTIGPAIQNGA